jgi:ATP-binding cassette subfamily C (CFTR/MRP) protein 1
LHASQPRPSIQAAISLLTAAGGTEWTGKSTLMNLLFRIVELDSGSISIDGVDIAKLGLKQLRSAISMLPQDPTL